MPDDAARRALVLGDPVEHSLSPVLHSAAYRFLGLTGWSYGRERVGRGELAAFLERLDDDVAGLSLTMPLKEEALDVVDDVSDHARLIGSVNTLLTPAAARGPAAGTWATSTDDAGVAAALLELAPRAARTGRDVPDPDLLEVARPWAGADVLLLGAGGTARAALAALRRTGARSVRVAARRRTQAEGLVELDARLPDVWRHDAQGVARVVDLEAVPDLLASADLVVQTLPAGVADRWADAVAALPDGGAPALLEVLYDPWPTALASASADRGAPVVGGLEVLVGQAVEQVHLMTGRRPDPDVLRRAGQDALAARG